MSSNKVKMNKHYVFGGALCFFHRLAGYGNLLKTLKGPKISPRTHSKVRGFLLSLLPFCE